MYPVEVTEPGGLRTDSPISGTEGAEVLKLLGGCRASGVDGIRPGYIKTLDVVGLSWLTRLCNIGGGAFGVENHGSGPHL